MTFNISGVNINGVNIYDSTGLYNFTTFTFKTGNVSGPVGATGSQLFANSYSNVGNTWLQTTSFYNTYGNGYQFWTVPTSGNYTITAAGARAGIPYFTPGNVANGNLTAGWGALVQGTFTLTQGQILTLVVGQMSGNAVAGATYSSTGGGGASWVVTATGSPLLVAGGGGGGGNFTSGTPNSVKGGNGVTTNSGGASTKGAPGGTNGNGGNSHIAPNGSTSSNSYDAGAGGGMYSNGVAGSGANLRSNVSSSAQSAGGGLSFSAGLLGGLAAASYLSGESSGGFGGGGGAGPITGGGGGGYSGGAGTWTPVNTQTDAGGGGGSYIDSTATAVATSDGFYNSNSTFNGSNITNLSSLNYGHGYITITRV